MGDHYSARRLPVDPGQSGWLKICDDLPSYPSLDQDISADWVIIGGGFTGLSAAKHLCEQSAGGIILLEASHISDLLVIWLYDRFTSCAYRFQMSMIWTLIANR